MRSSLWMAVLAVLLAAAGHAMAGYVDAVLADDPLLYWRLGESDTSDGQTAVNAATAATTPGSGLGSVADGTYKGSVASVAGALYDEGDTAAYFGTTTAGGSTGDYVILNPFPTASFPGTALTAEVWVKGDLPAADQQAIISYEKTGLGNTFLFFKSGATMYVYLNGASRSLTGLGAAEVFDGNWNHVAVTWQSSDGALKTYLNGVAQGTNTHQANVTIPQGGSFMMAQEQDGPVSGLNDAQKLEGRLDEVALYGSVLSATDIAQHYRAAWEKSVVACNVAVNSTTHQWTMAEHGPAVMNVLSAPNLGDVEVGIGAELLYAADGVMLATVRENGRGTPAKYGTAEVDRTGSEFGNGALSIATDRAVGGTETEMNINVATAFFPFAGYWTGGHVDATGTLVAANGISPGMLQHVNSGMYELKLPGVDSWDDGMLFVVGGSNSNTVAGTYPLSDGSGWRINTQSNDANYSSTPDDFSFLYMPYSARNLIGGMIQTNGDKMHYAGDFLMEFLGTGRYRLTIPGKTPEAGMLLLTLADEPTWVNPPTSRWPQDNILSYEAELDGLGDPTGKFIIEARDLTGLGTENTRFVFAYIDFENPPVLPEPATLTLLALGALGMVIRRRRSR